MVLSEWRGGSGKWYCNDVTNLTASTAKWWAPARALGMSLTDYILLLRDFKATIVKYNPKADVLIYYWDKQVDVHKFVLWINKKIKVV